MDAGSLAPSAVLPRPPAGIPARIPAVDWWITSRCNLTCDFCYGPLNQRDPIGLREGIFSAIEACSAGVVTFCGGEPLLVRDIDRYAKALAGRGKRTVLNTNGSLLRRRLGQGLELAFSTVGLSIDGSTEEVHRAMRGPKADLAEALRAAELVSLAPATSLKIGTVVSNVNQHDLPSLARLVRRLEPDVWRLYQYSSRGDQNVGQRRHRLSEERFLELAGEAAALAGPVPTAPSSEKLTVGCLIVDADGSVLEPTSNGYLRRGNCLTDPIDAIWAKIPSATTIIENKRWLSVLPQLLSPEAARPPTHEWQASHLASGLGGSYTG